MGRSPCGGARAVEGVDIGSVDQGVTDALFRTFLVYAACSPRPLHEIIDPDTLEIKRAFAQEFDGMTVEHVPLTTLEAARDRLFRDIRTRVTGAAGEFLLSIHDVAPRFDLISLPTAADLPAIQWKLTNPARLKDRNPNKHAVQRAALEAAIAKE